MTPFLKVIGDGIYLIGMQLSKCSIGFEFDPDEGYEPALLEEVSAADEVPEKIEHDSYGNPDYRIVTSCNYNGEISKRESMQSL